MRISMTETALPKTSGNKKWNAATKSQKKRENARDAEEIYNLSKHLAFCPVTIGS